MSGIGSAVRPLTGVDRRAAPFSNAILGERAFRKRQREALCEIPREYSSRRADLDDSSDPRPKCTKMTEDDGNIKKVKFDADSKLSVDNAQEIHKKQLAVERDALRDLVAKVKRLSRCRNGRFFPDEPRTDSGGSSLSDSDDSASSSSSDSGGSSSSDSDDSATSSSSDSASSSSSDSDDSASSTSSDSGGSSSSDSDDSASSTSSGFDDTSSDSDSDESAKSPAPAAVSPKGNNSPAQPANNETSAPPPKPASEAVQNWRRRWRATCRSPFCSPGQRRLTRYVSGRGMDEQQEDA